MKIKYVLLLLVLFSSMATKGEESIRSKKELLIDYKLLYTYSKDSLANFYAKRNIPQAITPIRYDVAMYEITYKGKWVDDSYRIAKGVLMVPITEGKIPEMAYCHGTRVAIKEKRGLDDPEQMITILHAADGYLAYFPFYYGLGGGEGRHIYQHAQTEALSVIYMIKASRNELLNKIGVKTDGQLFISGYSQGGHAAMATHKYIESGKFKGLNVTASAPLAGAFDMTGIQASTMYEDYNSTYFLPYLIVSYNEVYPDLYHGDIYNIFKEPYKKYIREYFEAEELKDFRTLNNKLPRVATDMLIDTLKNNFKLGDNPFVKKMAENNLYNWTPNAPSLLCACEGDNLVLPENTELTYETMKSNGAEVYIKQFGKHLGHVPCASYAVMYSKIFFDNIRDGKKNIEKVPFKKRMMLSIGIMDGNKKGKKKAKELLLEQQEANNKSITAKNSN